MRRRRAGDVLQVLASVVLLALAWRLAGGEALLAGLSRVQPGWLLLGLLLTVPMQLASAQRWRLTAARLGMHLPLGEALREYYLATLLNSLLPGGIAGDAARVLRHGGRRPPRKGRWRAPLHAVLLERGLGQAVMLALLGMGLLAGLDRWPFVAPLAASLAGLALLALALAVAAVRWLPAAAALAADLGRAVTPPTTLVRQLLLSLVVCGCYLLMFLCAVRATGTALPLRDALLVLPLVLTAMTLPVSVGGLGLREASAAALWPLVGLPAADGALAALAYGAVVLVGSLPALSWRWRHAPPAGEPAPEPPSSG